MGKPDLRLLKRMTGSRMKNPSTKRHEADRSGSSIKQKEEKKGNVKGAKKRKSDKAERMHSAQCMHIVAIRGWTVQPGATHWKITP